MADGDASQRQILGKDAPPPASNSGLDLLESITFRDDELPSLDDASTPGRNSNDIDPPPHPTEDQTVDKSSQRHERLVSSRGPTPSPNPFHKGVGGVLWDETFGRSTLATQSSPWSSRVESHLSMDEASFNLFTQSFDTLSDAGADYHQSHHYHYQQQQQQQSLGSMSHLHETPTKDNTRGPSQVDRATFQLDLPTLMPVDSGVSVGDLSPIQVDLDQDTDAVPVFTVDQAVVKLPRVSGDSVETQQQPHPSSSPVWHDISQFDHIEGGDDSLGSTTHYPQSQISNPFYVLRMSRMAFSGCTYLLDCLQRADLCAVNVHKYGSFHVYRSSKELTHRDDVIIAARRVEAAICAFGGTLNLSEAERAPRAIFRPKLDIPNPTSSKDSLQDMAYEKAFHKRYVVMASKISWEVEQDPPMRALDTNSPTSKNKKRPAREMSESNREGRVANTSEGSHSRDDETYSGSSPSPNASVTGIDAPKMKYRCKLCGKPKQNHDCPNLLSLQRSIGITVYSAVNAFTAHEPGVLTPALSQMNNFVFYDSDHSPEPSYEQPSLATAPRNKPARRHPSVTPETPRIGVLIQSPLSSFSTPSRGHSPSFLSSERQYGKGGTHMRRTKENQPLPQSTLSVNSGSPGESLFVEAVTLRPEHYRAVTPPKPTTTDTTDFCYPAVPLTYAERKRLSDTLFCFSREIPTVSENCAALLRTARERNEWDTAVAELLTQVVVGLYCGEGDCRLDGLHHYLLKLGVAC